MYKVHVIYYYYFILYQSVCDQSRTASHKRVPVGLIYKDGHLKMMSFTMIEPSLTNREDSLRLVALDSLSIIYYVHND